MSEEPRFLADAMLGRLARWLRMLGYDTVWGPAGRPAWIVTARTYPFVNASADALVHLIDERWRQIEEEDATIEGGDGGAP